MVARRAHNPKVSGSNPLPATKIEAVQHLNGLRHLSRHTCLQVLWDIDGTLFRAAYLAELERVQAELLADLRVLPGVREALATLRDAGITQVLLTGNLEPMARLKLACVNLDGYVDFDMGAYGSDHRDRTCLVPITRQRLHQRLGLDVQAQDIVVVGDTPRDIACARAGGARVIAVARLQYSTSRARAPIV